MKLKSNLTIILLHVLLATAIYAEKSSDDYIADLKSEDMNVQITAARKLGAGKVEKALPDLTALLGSPSVDVQVAAATAIGAIGKKGAGSDELLALAAGTKSALVKYAAYVALANTVDKEKTAAFQEALGKEMASNDALLKDLAGKLKKEEKKAKESDQG
ncbi:MAG: HEAT repeat domain-containing protein [Spirochaetales bacterium]|nr:HEAT repeat domain-containing protein [Spirochaetales bacterium]